MGVLILDKTDSDNLRKIYTQVTTTWFRFRSRMVKIMDQYYFKELNKEELVA